jgi:hypothetical protein
VRVCMQAYIHTYILSHLHTYVQLVETGNLKWIIGKQFVTMRIGLNWHEMGGGVRLILESVFCKATSVHKTHFRWKEIPANALYFTFDFAFTSIHVVLKGYFATYDIMSLLTSGSPI